VEGSERPGTTDYCIFRWISLSSARETSYLLGLAARLRYVDTDSADRMVRRYDSVCAALFNAVQALEADGAG
jgi:four helix bundle protein